MEGSGSVQTIKGTGSGTLKKSIPESDEEEGGDDGRLGSLHVGATGRRRLMAAAVGQRVREKVHKLLRYSRQLTLLCKKKQRIRFVKIFFVICKANYLCFSVFFCRRLLLIKPVAVSEMLPHA